MANIDHYIIGKGIVYFKPEGESVYIDLGNVPEFEFTPTIETLEHFSSREGVKTKDLTVVLQKSGTLRLVMEEWNANNLSMAVLGQAAVNASGLTYIDIFSQSQVSGAVKFVGTNDVGINYEWVFNKVDFIPGTSVSLISDEWGRLEITGNVAAVAGEFGKITNLDSSSGYSE